MVIFLKINFGYIWVLFFDVGYFLKRAYIFAYEPHAIHIMVFSFWERTYFFCGSGISFCCFGGIFQIC